MNKHVRKYLMPMALVAISCTMANAEATDNYYDSLDGLCGAELKTAIHQLCRQNYQLPKSSISSTYSALNTLFTKTDFQMIDGVAYWWDMYSTELNPLTMTFSECGYQREHSLPKSWWKDTSQSSDVEYTTAYCDMHHLFPSNGSANGSKSNWPLGICDNNPTADNGAVKIGAPVAGLIYGVSKTPSKVFEPGDEYKGDFARAYMYVVTAYQDLTWSTEGMWMLVNNTYPTLAQWAQDLLLEWCRIDPVSIKELDRNDAVETIQHNRNPFIDLANLHEYVWGDSINTPLNVRTTVKGLGPSEETFEDAVFYDRTWLADDTGDCTTETISGYASVWKHDTQYGWKASSYASGTAKVANANLVTPEIDLTGAVSANLTFDHALNYSGSEYMHVYVLEGGNMHEITNMISWPQTQSWKFVNSGEVSLQDYLHKKIRLVFNYTCDGTAAGTWEIKNVRVDGEMRTSTTPLQIVDHTDCPIEYYSIEGRKVNPEHYRGVVIIRQGSHVSKAIFR